MTNTIVPIFRPKPTKIIEDIYRLVWCNMSQTSRDKLAQVGLKDPMDVYYIGKGFYNRVKNCDDLDVFEAYCEFQDSMIVELARTGFQKQRKNTTPVRSATVLAFRR